VRKVLVGLLARLGLAVFKAQLVKVVHLAQRDREALPAFLAQLDPLEMEQQEPLASALQARLVQLALLD
jgi:hypothetical protein